jgi:hypothetical protein
MKKVDKVWKVKMHTARSNGLLIGLLGPDWPTESRLPLCTMNPIRLSCIHYINLSFL